MSKRWNLQDAKARLSELVDRARLGDAQVILRRGKPAAVVIAYEQFRPQEPERTLLSFLQSAPLGDAELELPPREVEPMRELH